MIQTKKLTEKTSFWLDCDPGIDDTMAIILGCFSIELNLIGISCSQGNSSVLNTSINCLKILKGLNKLDITII